MKVLALATQKGGTGKSSLAVSLAVAAQERSLKVYVVDLDPQATARKWFERREAEGARKGFDLVIIDTPGVDAPATTAAMHAADLCLVPARPSVADIEAARPTIRTLSALGKPFLFVLNQCPPGRSIRTTDAYRALLLMGAVAGVTLALRADHLDALAQGLGVTERDPNGKAAAEIRDLLLWLLLKLEGGNDEEAARVA